MDYKLSRRRFIRTAGMATAGILAAGKFNSGSFAAESRKPNIIYIMADDLGWGDLSCYGQKKFKTPNIDKLAYEGMRFTQHYSGSTVCAPSRCSLITGLHSGHCTIRDNFNKHDERVSLKDEDFTIGELMKKAGYKTGIVGKWGLGEPGTEGTPNKQGFDFWYGYLNQARAHSYYPEYVWRNDQKEYLKGNQNGGRETYVHDLFTEESLKFVERNKDNPFFLYLPYTIPHSDYDVPENSLNKFKGQYPEIPYEGDEFSTDTPKAALAGMITRMDDDVGKIVKLVKKLGLEEDTLIIFTSDNGPSPKNGNDPDFFNSSGPYRGEKRDLYEGGIRVPFIAKWKGKIEPNSFSHHVSTFWDFMPTLADLTGQKLSYATDGISYLPALLGNDKDQKKHDYLYWEYTFKNESFQAVRKNNWKLLRSKDGIELYDLSKDPGEDFDVKHLYPNVAEDLLRLAKNSRSPNDDYYFYLD